MLHKRSHYSVVMLVVLWILTHIFSSALAQQDARSVLVNYAETGDQDNRNQAVNVYFTLLDDDGKAVVAPTIDEVSLNLGGNTYSGSVSIPQTPLYITLVLDTSGSMKAGADQLRQAARQAVSAAPDGTFFSLYRFNETFPLIEGFTSDKNRQINNILAISNADFDGGTCLYDAAFSAIEYTQSSATAGRRAVIVFTDGRDELIAGGQLDPCSTHNINDVIVAARDRNVRVPIFTIGLQGSQQVNFSELERMAIETGGIAETGDLNQLSTVFQQVIQTLASQREASFNVCLSSNSYAGTITIDGNLTNVVNGIKLTTDCETPTTTPTPTATAVATATNTPVPPSIRIEDFQQPSPGTAFTFSIVWMGDGNPKEYEITIQDQDTRIRVDGPFGRRRVNANGTEPVSVSVTLSEVSTARWLICAKALDPNEQILAETCEEDIIPYRTLTPTPVPTETATPTPTETPTLTPRPSPTATATPFVDLPSITYLSDSNKFNVEVRTDNFPLDKITGYTVRVRQNDNNRTGVFTRTYNVAPTFPLEIEAVNDQGAKLQAGSYTVLVEFNIQGQSLPIISPENTVTIPVQPTPVPPSLVDHAATIINNNPVVAIVFGVALLLVLLLLILLIIRNRRGGGNGYEPVEYTPISRSPQGGMTDDSTSTQIQTSQGLDTLSSLGASLQLITSGSRLDQTGRTWSFNNSQLPYRIGRGGTKDYSVLLHLDDNGVSGLHAVIGFDNGQYWIMDEGSLNGTFINGEPVPRGKRQLLMSGDRIRLGMQTEFEFRDNKKELIEHATTGKIVTPMSPAKGSMFTATTSPLLDDDAPTEVDAIVAALPTDVTAEMNIISGMGTNPDRISIQTQEFTIGRRRKTNMYVIDNPGISRDHIRIQWHDGVFQIQNLSQTEGGTTIDAVDLPPGADPLTLTAGVPHAIELGRGDKQVQLQFQYTVPPASPDLFEDEQTIV